MSCHEFWKNKQINIWNPQIRPQSKSVMSALTIIQDVRHDTLVHIYSLLLPGKYRMKIKVPNYINILIVAARDLNIAWQMWTLTKLKPKNLNISE